MPNFPTELMQPLPASAFVHPNKRRPVFRDEEIPGHGAFSGEEILAANRRHDAHYGWSINLPTLYTNNARLPETVIVEPGRENQL